MDRLVDISGWADSYNSLCHMDAIEGEYYNVLEDGFFTTYRKTGETELDYINEETDVIAWYQVFAELKSNVPNPNDNDVYIVGYSSPYTRYKAVVRGVDINWEEDGTEEKKILRNYKRFTPNKSAKPELKEGIFYSVGTKAPYKVYGITSGWEPVGHIISNTKLWGKYIGEVAFVNGIFYLHTAYGVWEPIEYTEPIENYTKHNYVTKDGKKMKIREGFALGTLEFYSPRE